jgi:hypothetical protein
MVYVDFTKRIIDDYTLFLFALTGRYQSSRAQCLAAHLNARCALESDAYALASLFMSGAATDLSDYLGQMIVDAPEEVVSMMMKRRANALSLISGILVENVNTVKSLARIGAKDYANMLRDAHGAIGMLIQQKSVSIDFKATDTSNRKWNAQTLMYVVIRDFAYQTWVDSQASQFAAAGNDLMTIPGGVRVFSLLDTAGYESLSDVRAVVFHPNSNAIMVPYVSS